MNNHDQQDIFDYKNQSKELEKQISQLEQHRENLRAQLNLIQSAKAYKLWQKGNKVKKLAFTTIKQPAKIFKALEIFLTQGPMGLRSKMNQLDRQESRIATINEQYQIWLQKNYPTPALLAKQRSQSAKFKYQPLISIIVPTYNTNHQFLRECIESVINQSYSNWELCIADDCSSDGQVRKIIQNYAKKDRRIKYVFRKSNGHISRASNSALKLATGEYVGLLDHDDVLWPNALYEVAKVINDNPEVDFIYSDEDKLAEDGKTHCEPFFKPDWSPDLLMSYNYITHFTALKHSLINKIGGFRIGFEGSQDYDLFLRAIEVASQIEHIDTILYSWRKVEGSTSMVYSAKGYAHQASFKALREALERRKIEARVEDGICLSTFRVRYKIIGEPLVTIIIPTKNHADLLRTCVESILSTTIYTNYEIIIVDTGSQEKEALLLLKQYRQHPKIKIKHWRKPFNYSAVNNWAVRFARGEYLLFLNNDTEVISDEWLTALLEHAQRPEVGAVGAKLLYPNKTIQHAGIELLANYWPHHYKIGKIDGIDSSFPFPNYAHVIKNPDAVTGATLLVRKKYFDRIGGFDESLGQEFQDVLICKSLDKMGYSTVYTPFAILFHHESATFRGAEKKLDKVVTRYASFKSKLGKYKKKFNKNSVIIDEELFNTQNLIDQIMEAKVT